MVCLMNVLIASAKDVMYFMPGYGPLSKRKATVLVTAVGKFIQVIKFRSLHTFDDDPD